MSKSKEMPDPFGSWGKKQPADPEVAKIPPKEEVLKPEKQRKTPIMTNDDLIDVKVGINIPKKKKESKTHRISLLVTDTAYDKLKKITDSSGQSMNEVINYMLESLDVSVS